MDQSLLKKINKKHVTLSMVVLFCVILAILILRTQGKGERFVFNQTLSDYNTHFNTLYDDFLLSYDGLAFTRTRLSTGETSVLFSGAKLPVASTMKWADSNGVLIQFDESFYGSLVENALKQRGETINQLSKRYTWYLDFTNGTLSLVSKEPTVGDSVMFNSDEKGFYFVSDLSFYATTEDPPVNPFITPLYFYSIDTKETKKLSDDLGLTDISSVNLCPERSAMNVCVLGRSTNNPIEIGLFAVEKDGATNLVFSAERLQSTGHRNYYVELRVIDPQGGEEGGGYGESEVLLHDLNNELEIATKITNTDESYVVSVQDGLFFYIEGGAEGLRYSAETLNGKELKVGLQEFDTKSDVLLQSYGVSRGAGSILAITGLGDSIIFSPASINTRAISESEVNASLLSATLGCIDESAVEYNDDQKLIRVFFEQNEKFPKELKTFADCVYKQGVSLPSESSVYIGLTSPLSGKIVSD